jgi:hypothetical protein
MFVSAVRLPGDGTLAIGDEGTQPQKLFHGRSPELKWKRESSVSPPIRFGAENERREQNVLLPFRRPAASKWRGCGNRIERRLMDRMLYREPHAAATVKHEVRENSSCEPLRFVTTTVPPDEFVECCNRCFAY